MDPKYENAAMCSIERYITEGEPTLQRLAGMTRRLAERELEAGGRNAGSRNPEPARGT